MNDDTNSGPTPEGASDPERPRKRAVAVAAAVGVAGLVGGGLAAGALSSASASTDGNGAGRPGYGAPRGYGGPGGPAGPGGEGRPGKSRGDHKEVTGATRTKVVAAVKAKYAEATVEHVHQDPKGAYEAHVTNAGKTLIVLVSKDFEVTGTRTPPAGGPGRHGGPPPGGERPAPPDGERPAPPNDAPGSAEDPGARTS